MSLRLGSCKSKANGHNGGEWAKANVFFFEKQHHVVASVYACLTPYRPGCGIDSLNVFPSLLPKISTDQLKTFCFQFFSIETCSDQSKAVTSCSTHKIDQQEIDG